MDLFFEKKHSCSWFKNMEINMKKEAIQNAKLIQERKLIMQKRELESKL